jgi:hypothetical protein
MAGGTIWAFVNMQPALPSTERSDMPAAPSETAASAASTNADRFFVIGAMKAGTSSLYDLLAAHPEIYASPTKEPRYFLKAAPSAREQQEYAALFVGRTSERWMFEASTGYAKYPRVAGVPARIKAAHPEARFIYILRDPIERIWSHYVHNIDAGRETREFARAIDADPDYLDASRYHLQIEQYLAEFSWDRLLVLIFEEFVREPAGVLHATSDFLSLKSAVQPPATAPERNASRGKRIPARWLRAAQSTRLYGWLPYRVQKGLGSTFSRALPPKEEVLTDGLRARIADALSGDLVQLEKFLGGLPAAWRIPGRTC